LQHVIVRQPERAGQKGALARRQTIDAFMRLVAADEAIVHQLALDAGDRADHARVVGGEEADQRHHQQTGVRLRAP
jgi:hypothetical protein